MTEISGFGADAGLLAVQQMRAGQPDALAKRINSLHKSDANDAQARKTANDFEAMFLTQMMEHMSSGIKTDGPFGGGQGEAMFRSLLNQEYAGMLSKRGGIGIADHVYRQILALQEV